MLIIRSLALIGFMTTLVGCSTDPANVPAGPPGYSRGFANGCDSGYVAAGHPYYKFVKDVTLYAQSEFYRQAGMMDLPHAKGNIIRLIDHLMSSSDIS